MPNETDKIIDAKGLILLPVVIDPQRAASKSLFNYGFFIGATANNIADLLSVEPTYGRKIFMGSSVGGNIAYKRGQFNRDVRGKALNFTKS